MNSKLGLCLVCILAMVFVNVDTQWQSNSFSNWLSRAFNIQRSQSSTDYCKYKCTNGETNVGCNNTQALGPYCPKDATLYKFNLADINLVLNLHNKDRNQVSGGMAQGKGEMLSSACRMPKVVWSDQLAEVACFTAKKCRMIHDRCMSTDQYKYVGQNLAVIAGYKDYLTMSAALNQEVSKWFIESKNTTNEDIKKYPAHPSAEIGHFTNEVNDRTTALGCCASKYYDGKLYRTLIACNYASNNLVGLDVYLTPPCKNGIKCHTYDIEFPNLCLDKVDPNDIYYSNSSQ